MADSPAADDLRDSFETAVAGLFYMWPLLNAAVDGNWARGGNAAARREEMLERMLDFCAAQDELHCDEVVDLLLDDLDELFLMQVEDGSPTMVAQSICKMHREMAAGDRTEIDKLIAFTAQARTRRPAGALPVSSDSEAGEGEDGGGEDGGGEDGGEDAAADELRAAAEAERAARRPAPDADGWTTVTSTRKRRQ